MHRTNTGFVSTLKLLLHGVILPSDYKPSLVDILSNINLLLKLLVTICTDTFPSHTQNVNNLTQMKVTRSLLHLKKINKYKDRLLSPCLYRSCASENRLTLTLTVTNDTLCYHHLYFDLVLAYFSKPVT